MSGGGGGHLHVWYSQLLSVSYLFCSVAQLIVAFFQCQLLCYISSFLQHGKCCMMRLYADIIHVYETKNTRAKQREKKKEKT